MAKAGKLTNEQKSFIVQRLARFDTPTEVARKVKEEFGIELTRQAVQCYDPTRHAGRELSRKWVAVFQQERAEFLEAPERVPIASEAYRLEQYQDMYEQAKVKGNHVLAKELLEQAAKERGRLFERAQAGGFFEGAVFTFTPPPTAAQRAAASRGG